MADWLDVSDDSPRRAYTAAAGQTAFTFPFVFFSEADLKVYVNDVLKEVSTDYTTSGALDEQGGAVTFLNGLSAGDNVLISRVLDIALDTHIPASGPLDIPALNLQLSKIVAMLQQVDNDRLRGLHQPDSDADDLQDLPAAAARALAYLAFDADGQPIAAADPANYPASTFMATVLAATTAAAARAALGVTDQSSYTGLANWQFFR